MAKSVAIIPTRVANIASIVAAFKREKCKVSFASNAAMVTNAEYLVLPGVGAFSAGMHELEELSVVEALKARIQSGAKTLCVCLGLQLLFSESEESPGIEGLCVFPGLISRFPDSVRVPQLGWNLVEPSSDAKYLSPGYAYFANSYRVSQAPADSVPAFSDYAGSFLAGFESAGLLACQFHPELSGAWGQNVISRWLEVN